MDTAHLKDVTPDTAPPPLSPEVEAAIAALAERQYRASGLVMKAITFVGGRVEGGLKALPKGVRGQLDKAARAALEKSYDLAGRSRGGWGSRIVGPGAHKAIASVSGALGGLGGLPTALAELPVTTTVIFRAVQDVAAAHGEDPASVETRLECLRVFGAGGPGAEDDGIDTTFIGARLSLTGPAVNAMLARVAPRFAAMLGQKLATQAVPVLGAAAGAGTNLAFTAYYVEMAEVHFGLRRLIRAHGEAPVLDRFHKVLADRTLPAKS